MSGVRMRLAQDLEGQYEVVLAAIQEAMSATKRGWVDVTCKHCDRRQKAEVDFPDNTARMRAVELWLEQGFGRPGATGTHESPATIGVVETREQLEALTLDQLHAYHWVSMSPEERETHRRLLQQLSETTLPTGFWEALNSVEELPCVAVGAAA